MIADGGSVMIPASLTQDLSAALFVRQRLLARIVELIQRGECVKLVGLPEIGITTVMKQVATLCADEGELSREFFAIYLAGSYDGDRVRGSILSQLRAAGLAVEGLQERRLREILEVTRRIVAGKRLLLVCDDFQKNFVTARPESLLTVEHLRDISDIAEDKRSGIQFVVNYTHPVNFKSSDDYYLYKLFPEDVGWLTPGEAKELITRRWRVENLAGSAEAEAAALHYGGRHPLILDRAARWDLLRDAAGFRDWARRRYAEMVEYINNSAVVSARDQGGAEALLREIARRPMRKDQFEAYPMGGGEAAAASVLARRYCYEEKGEDGEVRYHVFAEGFAEFLGRGPILANQQVMLVHGIRTRADWQREVKDALEDRSRIRVRPIKYGYFDAVRFLLPFDILRDMPVRTIEQQYRYILTEGLPISVIAHSYGTYIIGRMLELNPDVKFERIVLCASVLPDDFPWQRYKQGQVKEVVNDCGSLDVWPVLAESASWGYGSSGTFGFGKATVEDRYYRTRHGELLNAEHARQFWRPFIEDGKVVAEPRESLQRPWYFATLRIPLKWLLVAGLLVMLVALAYRQARTEGRTAAPPRASDAGHSAAGVSPAGSNGDRGRRQGRKVIGRRAELQDFPPARSSTPGGGWRVPGM